MREWKEVDRNRDAKPDATAPPVIRRGAQSRMPLKAAIEAEEDYDIEKGWPENTHA
jgi:hypothetical protein